MDIQTLDGIAIYFLPDNARCAASDGFVSHEKLDNCPTGCEVCYPEGLIRDFEVMRMKLSELTDKLYDLNVGDDDPDVYIRIGLQQVELDEVKYYPETDEEYSAVVIS